MFDDNILATTFLEKAADLPLYRSSAAILAQLPTSSMLTLVSDL